MKKENLTIVAKNIRSARLTELPFEYIGDLAFTICTADGINRTPVTFDLDLTEEELKRTAISNDEEDAILGEIEELMFLLMLNLNIPDKFLVKESIKTFSFERSPMWVLTNKSAMYGAGLMANTDLLSRMGGRVGDFFIIPSSIHEVLIVAPFAETADEITKLIKEINTEEVKPADRLSDALYYWDHEKKLLCTAAQHFSKKKVEGQA